MEMEMEMDSMSSIRKNRSRRRFDDEQIKLLETMFETEARPELHMKQQLANKLGLHPRQIAIWFQNKRARSKSKQIEREYNILKMSYDNLASKVESLKKEKQSLLVQLQRLQKMTERSSDEECQNKDHMPENDDNPNFLAYEHEYGMLLCSDENEKVEYLEEEVEVLNMAYMADDGSLSSVENRYNFETIELLDWQYQL